MSTYDLTRAQRANCKKLIPHLEALPEDYGHFDMGSYITGGDHEAEHHDRDFRQAGYADYAKHNGGVDKYGCGTVACAVGHGPAAGVYFRARDFSDGYYFDNKMANRIKVRQPDWDEYSYRFLPKHSAAWNWCFGALWERVDNHHWGAAARLKFILAGRELPDDFDHWSDPRPEHVELYAEFRRSA